MLASHEAPAAQTPRLGGVQSTHLLGAPGTHTGSSDCVQPAGQLTLPLLLLVQLHCAALQLLPAGHAPVLGGRQAALGGRPEPSG